MPTNTYACPKCGEELSLTQTKDFSVDPNTGLVYMPIIDNFISCGACDWYQDSQEDSDDERKVIQSIIDNSLKEDLL